ncbi:MAG: 50S ribosomal protein L23 [bacterium]
MKSAYEIIKGPMITEKSTAQKKLFNKVSFEVDKLANKIEIKQAVQDIFNVKVDKISVIHLMGKKRRLGVHQGKRADRKKAIVTLAEGETIELLEGP